VTFVRDKLSSGTHYCVVACAYVIYVSVGRKADKGHVRDQTDSGTVGHRKG
jgi:hypothetical protein